jgi:hypothetical protein
MMPEKQGSNEETQPTLRDKPAALAIDSPLVTIILAAGATIQPQNTSYHL